MSYRRLFSGFPCICVIFLALHRAAESSDETGDRLLPAYAIASRADLLDSSACGEELWDFRNAVDRRILWSLKILDSSGAPKPGFLYGNNFWLGSRSQCLDTMNSNPMDLGERERLNNSLYRNPREEFPPFEVNYFVAYFKHNSTLQYHIVLPDEDIITLGLCLPASCSTNNISFILKTIFHDRVLSIGDFYSADFRLVQVKDLKDDHQWLYSGGVFFICFILVLTWTLMAIGTAYDILVYQKYLKAKDHLRVYGENTTLPLQDSNGNGNNSKDTAQSEDAELTNSFLRKESKIGQVLMCFSVYTNTKIICNTKQDAKSMPVLHGLRFLGMCWVIMVHTVFYTMEFLDDKAWALRFTETFAAQIISNSTLTVDTYFFLSGFLLAYIYLTETMGKTRTKTINYATKLNEFFVVVTKRLIRLTPAYVTTIGIVYLSSSWHSRTSQFYMSERPHETCAEYWWRNLLFVNNMFDHKTMCMSWSWYLSNDTQYFIIGLILLILSSICFYVAAVTLCILLLSTTLLTGYIAYINDYSLTLDEQYRLLDVMYDPPWTRIGPYIVGMITAYVVLRLNKKLSMKRRTVILCWCLGSACNILVLFGLYDRHVSVLAASFYGALNRTVWAIGLAWILIACYTKHGGIVNRLLSLKLWIPFSRLTYCAYLLNPFVISSIHLFSETPVHVDLLPLLTMFIGCLVATYLAAYVLTLMSEAPYVSLMRKFVQPRGVRK